MITCLMPRQKIFAYCYLLELCGNANAWRDKIEDENVRETEKWKRSGEWKEKDGETEKYENNFCVSEERLLKE